MAEGGVPARRLAEVGALLLIIIGSTNYVVVKAAIEVAPPILLAFARLGLASAVLFAFVRIGEGSVGLPRRDLGALALVALIGISLYQLLWTTAFETTTAGNAALIIASTPVLTMVVSALGRTDSISRPKVIGALISLGGVALVIVAGHGALGSVSFGDILSFGAAICWAVSVGLGAPVMRRMSPVRAGAWMMGIGAIGLLPVAAIQAIGFDIGTVPPAAWGGVVYSAVLASALAGVLMFNGIAVLGPNCFAVLQFLAPAITLVVGFFALGEPIGAAQVLGGCVIIAGILLARTSSLARVPKALIRSSS